jgi:branched-chain amino acid transport system substrate-binding protein
MKIMNNWRSRLSLAAVTVASVAWASPAMATGTVTVGLSTTLSGPIAELGQTGMQGVEIAIDALNSAGGLLGKHIKLVTADDNLSPATGTTNVRHMILDGHVVAIFGPVSSAAAAAEEAVAAQYKVPIFFFTSNDVKLTTSGFTKYAFQVVPNTVMEPRAVAAYIAAKVGTKPITVSTITPNYSFGRDSVTAFLDALKADGVKFTLKAQETPQLGASQYTSYIAALLGAHAQYTYIGQYGGDLITFTKQAEGFGFFKHTVPIASYDRAQLKALAGKAPPGAIAFDRAVFWAMKGPGMAGFIKTYHKRYHEWPSTWAILGYTAVQSWADGVKTAGNFDADKVSAALSGATVGTIRGPVHLRACDHQAEVGEYVGEVAPAIDPKYGFQIYSTTTLIPAAKIMLSCKEAQALQPKS